MVLNWGKFNIQGIWVTANNNQVCLMGDKNSLFIQKESIVVGFARSKESHALRYGVETEIAQNEPVQRDGVVRGDRFLPFSSFKTKQRHEQLDDFYLSPEVKSSLFVRDRGKLYPAKQTSNITGGNQFSISSDGRIQLSADIKNRPLVMRTSIIAKDSYTTHYSKFLTDMELHIAGRHEDNPWRITKLDIPVNVKRKERDYKTFKLEACLNPLIQRNFWENQDRKNLKLIYIRFPLNNPQINLCEIYESPVLAKMIKNELTQ